MKKIRTISTTLLLSLAAAGVWGQTLWTPDFDGYLNSEAALGELEFAVNPCAADFVGLILEVEAVNGTLHHHHLYAQLKAPPTLCGCADTRIIGDDSD